MSIKTIGAAAIGAVVIGLGTGNVAQAATFLGNSVQADNLFPDNTNVVESLGTQLIDADGATFTSIGLEASALVTSTNILITNLTSRGFTSAPFSGFRFSDVNGTIDSIIGISLASNTIPGFDISRVTFNPDQIFVNLQGLSADANQTVSLDVQFASTPIPTPALLPGLIGMGIAALRKRKQERAEAVEV